MFGFYIPARGLVLTEWFSGCRRLFLVGSEAPWYNPLHVIDIPISPHFSTSGARSQKVAAQPGVSSCHTERPSGYRLRRRHHIAVTGELALMLLSLAGSECWARVCGPRGSWCCWSVRFLSFRRSTPYPVFLALKFSSALCIGKWSFWAQQFLVGVLRWKLLGLGQAYCWYLFQDRWYVFELLPAALPTLFLSLCKFWFIL